MTFDSDPLVLHRRYPFFCGTDAPGPDTGSLGAAPPWASPARDIEEQGLRVLRCTAQALAATAGGLRFTPGARPWLDGLAPTAAMQSGQGGEGRHASSPEPRR